MKNIINGVNLQLAANAILQQDRQDRIDNLPDKSIIWCKTEYIEYIFNTLKDSKKSYTLITHCSDHAITEKIFYFKPKCIKKWFAQNVDYKHPDLIPVPIGIENHIGPNKGGYTDFTFFEKQAFNFTIKNKIINKIYCNFRQTHPSRILAETTIKQKNIGIFEKDLSFVDYSKSVDKFLFVLSPRGNGIDCHRTWEALYYGCVPIVEKHFMYDMYTYLPIIQLDNWNNLTLQILEPYIQSYKNNTLFNNMQELKLDYWINKIKNTLQ